MQKNRLAVVRRTGAFSLVALGRRWVAVSVALALAGAGVVVVTPVAEAAPPIPVDCSTMNLQTAMNEASPGATLAISGICVGHFTIDGKALTLVRNGNTATLDGGQTGTVLTITDGADVTLDQLTITHGATADAGGGIYNGGTLTLNAGSVVTGSVAGGAIGGGIFNATSGTLTLNAGSVVTGNGAFGGGGIYNGGTLTLNAGSVVTENIAYIGGGIYNAIPGAMILNAGSVVSRNEVERIGGGIVNGGTLTLNAGSSVIGNSAEFHGGGIYNFGILTGAVDGRDVRDNTPDNIFPPEG